MVAAVDMATDGDEAYGIMKRATLLRLKYRVYDTKKKLQLTQLGVHPKNRAGIYPNANRVERLGTDILRDGFNLEEANHEGVCVQEVPMDERRGEDPAVAGYFKWNLANAEDPKLKVCFTEHTHVAYGTLSHSHLLLVLLAFVNGAEWDVPDEFRKLLNENGGWDFAAVAARDPVLKQLCQDGLHMEVLSWKMCTEEPEACSLISQALNRGQTHALKTTEITAIAARELESAVAGKLVFETVQQKVR